ncbi:MAG: glutamate--tRNA ligase [Prevotellaceae bacterium]|jgi:glutamyl-tRNA synthetase|nr:glutamate--tRNA ligase [Prevotellaceae bacterium]
MTNNVRTRFAPSPTGYMHIGNLRTALYAFLFAKSQKGSFVLRIEDTDQKRYVEGATRVVYETLKAAQIQHDEGPDIGGNYGPYTQSERKDIYKKYALELVDKGHAYYCFCQKDGSENSEASKEGYNRHCRNLSKEEVQSNLSADKPFVIRQKMPLEGETSFNDLVFGEIAVENKTLDDQILLKSDGLPTYNFANVVDDYLMKITHVIRGSEYLSSNPKYILLYRAFGWDIPSYIHLPLIVGKNDDGTVSKLSKRHGAVSFQDLINDGYLPSAINNYISLLGWSPKSEKEIFSMEELIEAFSLNGINKSPAIFDYQKLDWVNSEHIKLLPFETFSSMAFPYSKVEKTNLAHKWNELAVILQPRIHKFSEIPALIHFLHQLGNYSVELFINKKNKSTLETSTDILTKALETVKHIGSWEVNALNISFTELSEKNDLKFGQLMWPVRIALSGLAVTPGGATEIMSIIGKEESKRRLNLGLKMIQNH